MPSLAQSAVAVVALTCKLQLQLHTSAPAGWTPCGVGRCPMWPFRPFRRAVLASRNGNGGRRRGVLCEISGDRNLGRQIHLPASYLETSSPATTSTLSVPKNQKLALA